ncbi:hypothetical protein CDD81_600 [Ophiocordyceps australis]|uniref:Lysozyme n=1 Tax=Ophiocordyceps australis TaxID=1399860 RepID=A0A2C5Y9B0_9HYPO|nr:hypothetical protein CDD81_600 [Ophiocordyceps australis]
MLRLWIPSLTLLGLATSTHAACTGPAVNQATIDLVSSFEQFRSSPYIDATGHPTIGFGHKCSNSQCSDVAFPKPLSEANGYKLLGEDLKVAQNCVTRDTTSSVVLNANQYGATVSWAFNVGCGAAASSTLIRRLNNGEAAATVLPQELPKWNKGNGRVVDGLVRRRRAEVQLANTPTSQPGLPAGC